MKKILTFLDYNLSVRGGAQYSSLLIMKELENDFDFSVVMPGIDTSPEVSSILLKNLDYFPSLFKKPFTYLELLVSLKMTVDKIDCDIYHCQMPVSLTAIGLLKKLNLIKKKPLIYTDRGLFEDYHWINKCFFKWLSSDIDTFITTTHKNKLDWCRYLGNRVQIQTIYNTSYTCFESSNNIYQREDRDSINIGFAGRYCDVKDWPLAESIILDLAKYEFVNVYMAIGIFTNEDVFQVNEMKSRLTSVLSIDRLNLKTNLDINEMKDFFSEMDIFISTSKTESFGRVAVEAMSQLCCVFGKKTGGLQEVIGYDDFIYTDKDDLNSKLLKLIFDRNAITEAQKMFYSRYINNFSVKKNIDSYKVVYENV